MASSLSLSLLPLNVNGLIKTDRRQVIFNSLSALNFDIIFLQETRIETTDQIAYISKQWDGLSLWHEGSRHSKGVGFLFSKRLKPIIKNPVKDVDGRLFKLDCIISNIEFTLVNVYCPNDHTERITFLQNLSHYTQGGHFLVLGEDFNFVENPLLDKRGEETERGPPPDYPFLKSLLTPI